MDLTTILDNVNPWMIKIAGALLILFIGFIIGRVIGQLIKRMLRGINLDRNVRKTLGTRFSLENAIAQVITILIYAAAVIMTLDYLDLTTVILTIITTAIIVILAVSLLLAVKDLLPNFFAGITLKYRRDFKDGDIISVKGVTGKVEEISLLSTKMTSGKDTVIIPNSVFLQEGYQVTH